MQHIKYKPTNKGYEMNIEYKITFGTEYNKDGETLISTDEQVKAMKMLQQDIKDHFGGMSIIIHGDTFKHDSSEMINEGSLSYEIVASDKDRKLIVSIAEDIKEILNQESVLLVETKINAVFI